MGKIYALSVGINDYSPAVGKLRGCLNDVEALKDYLSNTFGQNRLCFETLTDSDATRENIIKLFRSGVFTSWGTVKTMDYYRPLLQGGDIRK
ncbi:MAG: caspase family protein [Candidatus Electrothrix sp. AW2]|nr:caspase family protein [Candidatus Electrothrix gigas]